MTIQSPKQKLVEKFGTRSELVKQILPLIEGNDDDQSALMGASNAKLLRIYDVAEKVKKQFGGKAALIDAIAVLQFEGKAPNDGWKEKMEGKTVKFLFDKYRQLGGKKKSA